MKLTLAIIGILLSACVMDTSWELDSDLVDDGTEAEAVEIEAGDVDGLLPVYVHSFDHEPTAAEVEEAFAGFVDKNPWLVGIGALQPSNPYWPANGQKRVTLTARTGDRKNAGNDKASKVSLYASWRANTGQNYGATFVLNNPDRDDLERNRTDVFYYILSINQYAGGATSDTFRYGRIQNSSTDGWFCDWMKVADMNNDGVARTQNLPFAQWVDSPHKPNSANYNGNITWSLSYY